MAGEYNLTVINGLECSVLRKEFENFEGELAARNVSIDRITGAIADLEKRPEYTPQIRILQLRSIDSGLFYVFDERIYTNNQFLEIFEVFLRTISIPVEAVNFEDVPEQYKQYFRTDYTAIPAIAIAGEAGRNDIPQILSINYNESCTLKMIEPSRLYEKLEQVEKEANFWATIKKTDAQGYEEVISSEQRKGNKNVTIEHLIFRQINS